MESTKDYSIFREFSSNREIDQKHVNQLVRSIEKHNLLKVNPIVVDKQMRVIDGQHRLAAAQILDVEIYYIQDEINRKDISLLNSNQKNWSAMDYINFYTVEKVPAYMKFSNLVNNYPRMKVSALLELANIDGVRNIKDLKEGDLNVSNIDEAKEVCEICKDMYSILLKAFVYDSKFPLALSKALAAENFKIERLFEQAKAFPRDFVACHSKVQYMEMIKEIYNRNLSKNKIYKRGHF